MAYFSNNRTGLKGVDVASYQGNMNWATAKAQGVSFAIIRTILHWVSDLQADPLYHVAVDPYAYYHSHNARANGIEVCGYHYITPTLYPRKEGALAEAERFADGLQYVFGDLDPGYPYGKNIPTIDVEYPYNANLNDYPFGLDAYIEYVETMANHLMEITGFNTVIIYTATYYANVTQGFNHSTRGYILNKFPLWLSAKDPSLYVTGARQGNTPEPAYPNGNFTTFGNWGSWLGWQYAIDNTDVSYASTYGTTSADIDLDVLAPGYDLSVLRNDYWKPRNTSPGGAIMPSGGTNLQHISLTGDEYVKSPTTGKETLVKQNFLAYKNIAYTDLTAVANNINGVANTLRLIDGIPGKRIVVTKLFVYTPTTWAGGTQGFSVESDEATPKVWGTVASSNMTSGNKTNSDGFTGFTAGAYYCLALPDGVGLQLRDIATPTSGTAQIYLNFEYL